jgi:hypothetical protein
MDFAGALSPVLAQAGYLFPNTPMAVEQLFHLRSDSTAQPFDILFSPDPTSCHYCPYTTIGADINITGSPPSPKTYQPDAEDILNTITAKMQTTIFNAMIAANLDVCTSPPPPIHLSSMVMRSPANSTKKTRSLCHSPLTPGSPWARFGPHARQAFLTTTHHPRQKPWRTTHTNYKYHRPNANFMYERVSQPPCPPGILMSADIRWDAICIDNTTDVLWQLLHCTHTKSTYSPTHRTQHI